MSARLVGQASRAATELQLIDRDRITLLALADMANAEHQCWPAAEFLANLTGCGVRTIKRSVQNLATMGLIDRRHRGPRSAITTINADAIEAHADRFDQRWKARRAEQSSATPGTPFTTEAVPPLAPLPDQRGATCDKSSATGGTQAVPPVAPKPIKNHQIEPPSPPQSVGDTQEALVPEIVEGGRAMAEVGAVLEAIYDRVGYTIVPNRTQQLRDLEVAIDLGHRPADLIEKCTKNLETAGVKASVIATRIRDLAIQKPDLGFAGFTIQGEYDSTLVDLGGPECAHCNDEGQWRNPDLNEYQPCPHCDKGF